MDHRAKCKAQNNESSRRKKQEKIFGTYNRHIVLRLDTKAQFLKEKKNALHQNSVLKEDEKTNYEQKIFANHISIMDLYLQHIKNY